MPGPAATEPKPAPARPWRCRRNRPDCAAKTPCGACLGARNKAKGARKQRLALRSLETIFLAAPARYRTQTANEETWYHLPVLAEVKSGQQIRVLYTKFLVAESAAQSADPYSRHPVLALAPWLPHPPGRPTLAAVRLSGAATLLDSLYSAPVRTSTLIPHHGRPFWTRYNQCVEQADAARTSGDDRPFALAVMPDGTSDGLLVFRLEDLSAFAAIRAERLNP